MTTETPTPCRPPRGVVDLAVELAARVQRGHDHFEGGLGLELGVRVDGDAAAVVGDGEEAVGLELHLDPVGVARPPPRPWRCRSPRRTGGAAPSRRCRRRTCRAGAARARGLPAPRCRRPCSSRSCRLACERHEPLSLSPPASCLPAVLRPEPRCLAGPRERRAPPPAAPRASAAASSGLPRLESSDLPNRSRKAPRRKAAMVF